MPKAPADYQMRYPIDFAEIGPNVHKVVQLYAQDHGKSRGILWMPTSGQAEDLCHHGASARRVRASLFDSILGRGRVRSVRAQHALSQ